MLATMISARMPSPNQAICRSATPPPARPTCSVASVVALSATRATVAPTRGQSTFCSNRRSIPTIGRQPPNEAKATFSKKMALKIWRAMGAAVGDGGRHARHLHGRHQHLALADRHVHRLAGVPRRRLALARHPGLRDEPGLLAAEV